MSGSVDKENNYYSGCGECKVQHLVSEVISNMEKAGLRLDHLEDKVTGVIIDKQHFITRQEADTRFYYKGELDKMFHAIEQYAAGVKHLIDLYSKQFAEDTQEVKAKITTIETDIKEAKAKTSNKIIEVICQVLMLVLGATITFILKGG